MVRNFRRLSWSLSLMRLLHTIDSINKARESERERERNFHRASENIIYKLVDNDNFLFLCLGSTDMFSTDKKF